MPYKRRLKSPFDQIEDEIRASHKRRLTRDLWIVAAITLVGMVSMAVVLLEVQSVRPDIKESQKLREEQWKERMEIIDQGLEKKDSEVGKKDSGVGQLKRSVRTIKKSSP